MDNQQELLRGAEKKVNRRASRNDAWIDQEVAACEFKDVRLGKRFRTPVEQFSENVGGSIPWACQDWANTKAAYRFLSNEPVSEYEILAGHFQSPRSRLPGDDSPILILHDTTEFTYHREDTDAVGILHRSAGGKEHGRSHAAPHHLRHFDAFQLGRNDRRTAAGTGGD